MGFSKCGSCGRTSFKIEEQSPVGSNFKVMFVQCTACGVPIGVMDYWNVGTLIKGLGNTVAKIESRLDSLEHNIRIVNDNIRRVASK